MNAGAELRSLSYDRPPRNSYETALSEAIDDVLSVPTTQRHRRLPAVVDLVLAADLPAEVYDRAIDLLWTIAYPGDQRAQSAPREREARRQRLLALIRGNYRQAELARL